MRHLFLLLCLFLLHVVVTAASASVNRLRFSHLTNKNGLPGNTVFAILEDQKGYFWFGTKNGVCKYDGKTFVVYEHNSSDTTSLLSNDIRYLYEDSNKAVWAATNYGLTRYNREQDRFETVVKNVLVRGMIEDGKGGFYIAAPRGLRHMDSHYNVKDYVGANNILVNGNAMDIVKDENGNLWVATKKGLYHVSLKDSAVTLYYNDPRDKNSIPTNDLLCLYIDQRNNLWVGTADKGLLHFDPHEKTFSTVKSISNSYIHHIREDDSGRLWVGTEWGLNIYDVESGENLVCLNDLSDNNSINDNAVYSIYKDRDNNMVIGTYFGGVNLLLKSYQRFALYVPELSKNSIGGKAVRQIIGAEDNDLWIATENGGLNYYHSEDDNFTRYGSKSNGGGLTSNNVHSLLKDDEGMLWIGTYLGGLNRYDPKTGKFTYYMKQEYPIFNNNNVFALLQDRDGLIWIGTTSGLLNYDKSTNKFVDFESGIFRTGQIDVLFEDSSGNIWLGTHFRGVFKYNKHNQEVINYSTRTTPSISDDYINYVYEDKDKNIWVSTHYGGLNLIRTKDNTVKAYDKEDGLPSNTTYGLTEDNEGNLWIATNNGLARFDRERRLFSKFTTQDGLPNDQFNYNSVYKDKLGRIYFGTINGLIRIQPGMLNISQTNPRVDIVDMRIMGKSVFPNEENSPLKKSINETSNITLTESQAKSFSFIFSAPSLVHSRNISYAIKLSDIDKEWVDLGNQDQVTYANLPAGAYDFMVRAALDNNWNESEIRVIHLTVLPPFWKSETAYVIYFLILLLLIFLVYRIISIRQKEHRLIITERLEKEKLKEVNRLKINFFTNISHELRTPLTLIVSPIYTILTQSALPEEVRVKIQAIQKNVQRMQNLVDELILLSKIETEVEKIRVKEGYVLRFIIEIANGFKLLAESKNILFSINITVSKYPVYFDPSKLEKIVFNLLSNALKFTDAGGEIRISAGLYNDNGTEKLRIEVADSGCGISEGELSQIFDKYYQTINTKENSGFGIGLNMVRQLAQLHKGDISVESSEGKGSKFTVVVNVDRDSFKENEISSKRFDNQVIDSYSYLIPEENKTEINTLNTDNSQERPHILIVEDNRELLNFIDGIFNKDYRTTLRVNGHEGLIAALDLSPDLIISDLMMPVMDGLQFCNEIKSSIETCHIPFVILTAKSGDENKMEGYEYGAEAYVEKPFNPTILQQRVKNLLKMQQQLSKRMRNNLTTSFTEEPDICVHDKKLLESIHNYVIEHIDKSFSVTDITETVGISRTLLHTKLKKLVGLSATEYITKIRLEHSLKLINEGRNVSEVAYMVGFTSPNYFSRCFKKAFSISPREYSSRKGR